jgi:deoxyribodipyrimidine photo-lyase
MLSAHNRFGTISIRELYHTISDKLGMHHTLMNEIHWREFFSHVLYHFPQVSKSAFRQNYSTIPWKYNKTHIDAWKIGRTGFPIVDAGMRELNNTGFMHNRMRMIVASFLTKDLHVDWKIGERYFAEKLIDYDLAVNNGNWQWVASTGCDAQPWFRIFNPWRQQKKFDSECKYIKKWIPELEKLSADQIHRLETESFDLDYPRPIVDHSEESRIAKQMFQH